MSRRYTVSTSVDGPLEVQTCMFISGGTPAAHWFRVIGDFPLTLNGVQELGEVLATMRRVLVAQAELDAGDG